MMKKWAVVLVPDFEQEVLELTPDVRTKLVAHLNLLERFGPMLGRPRADTLKGSKHSNMKELRFDAGNGAWRAAYAFDSKRKAVVLVAGDKSGGNERAFYRRLIAIADARFDRYLKILKDTDDGKEKGK